MSGAARLDVADRGGLCDVSVGTRGLTYHTSVSWLQGGAAAPDADEDVKGIPKFWLSVLQNFNHTGERVEEHDVPILEALQNITMTYSPKDSEKDYFDLNFFFGPNEYFKNKTLSKRYFIKLEAEEGELMCVTS